MPAIIHVVYDPKGRISNRPEQLKTIGASAVMFHLEEPLAEDNIGRITTTLVNLLLKEIASAD